MLQIFVLLTFIFCVINAQSPPTGQPTTQPSAQPTLRPSSSSLPSSQPTSQPTSRPTRRPTSTPISHPSAQPTSQPTLQPSNSSSTPTSQPSTQPTSQPTLKPNSQPTSLPSSQPNSLPSSQPTSQPTSRPTRRPTSTPISHPSAQPTSQPTLQPSNPSSKPTSQPSQPSIQPTAQPSLIPSSQPTALPSSQPSLRPSSHPTSEPTQPSSQPTASPTQPSVQPTSHPSKQPSSQPSSAPSRRPTGQPSLQPTTHPSMQPSVQPTVHPSAHPSNQPTNQPSSIPTLRPTVYPTGSPTDQPTSEPTQPSVQPTSQPSKLPTPQPTSRPSRQPSCQPSSRPSNQPNSRPTTLPSSQPTVQPSQLPSTQPSSRPSSQPNSQPTILPTSQPSLMPSVKPSGQPSAHPSSQPTGPTSQPSSLPTTQPSSRPTRLPSSPPSCQPSPQPSRQPTSQPLSSPTSQPSQQPSAEPSTQPTNCPSISPSSDPSSDPSSEPTTFPSSRPTNEPTTLPSSSPSARPTLIPTAQPSITPSSIPTNQPSTQPTTHPTSQPSNEPSSDPSCYPSQVPSGQPSSLPSLLPTAQPSISPTCEPTVQPSVQPSLQPSASPTSRPTMIPSTQPTTAPSMQPTFRPTGYPTTQPTSGPTSQPTSQPSADPSALPTSLPSTLPTRKPSSQPSNAPSGQPSAVPTGQPSAQPSSQPTDAPTSQPTWQPSSQPTRRPTTQPSAVPSNQPSSLPTGLPSGTPSGQPSNFPTSQPTGMPSTFPTTLPTAQPSNIPTMQPSRQPTNQPSCIPTMQPTAFPTSQPSVNPTMQPTGHPTNHPTNQPTFQPSMQPTRAPSTQPTSHPSTQPSSQPSFLPTGQPSRQPSRQPTLSPSMQPTVQPSSQPSATPTCQPTSLPSRQPTAPPTSSPTMIPTVQPSAQPSLRPTGYPTTQPTSGPTSQPTSQPSADPSALPTSLPSTLPTRNPSSQPSNAPSGQPSAVPTGQPSAQPSSQPTDAPTSQPTWQPSSQPTRRPTTQPSAVPSNQPSSLPTGQPSGTPSGQPSKFPSCQPSAKPTSAPSMGPSSMPTQLPTSIPTCQPSRQPTCGPTSQPTRLPSSQPSPQPTNHPTMQPTKIPSVQPTNQPTMQPTSQPSQRPTTHPTNQPSSRPSSQPSAQPSAFPSVIPSVQPSVQPTRQPASQPSSRPSSQPSITPSSLPTCQPTSQPSIVPSAQPSQSPTAQPNAYPSSRPTSQPISRPSSQPTRQPSSQPTAQPVLVPSTYPTRQPSAQPSRQPNARPTSQPSGQPTGSPIRLNVVKTSRPTPKPTPRPTMFPSSWPTSQPTLTMQTRWLEKLELITSSFSGEFPVEVDYSDVYFAGQPLMNEATGSYCDNWKSALSQLTIQSMRHRPMQLRYISLVSIRDSISVENSFTCTAVEAVANVSSNLIDTFQAFVSSASKPVYPSAISCRTGSNETVVWRVGLCGGVPYLNLSLPSGNDSAYGILSPCSRACEAANVFDDGLLRYFSVGYSDKYIAPAISNLIVIPGQSSLVVNMIVASVGVAYCSAFEATNFIPPSRVDDLLESSVQVPVNGTSHSIVTLTIANLLPSTTYKVLCYTSLYTSYTSLSLVLSNLKTVSSLCCKSLAVKVISRKIPVSSGISSNIYIMPSSMSPSSSVQVQVNAYFVVAGSTSIVKQTNLISPALYTLKAGSVIDSIYFNVLSIPAVGTLIFNVSLVGSAATEFQVEYPNGNVISIVPLTQSLPAPILASALFANDGSYIIGKFDAASDKAGLGNAIFTCSALFDFIDANLARCQWDSQGQQVSILLPSTSSILIGSQIQLRAGFLRASCNSNVYANCSSWPTSSSTAIQVTGPEDPISPTVIVTAPSVVGVCDAVPIDVSLSLGAGGREWSRISFSVISSARNASDMQIYLNSFASSATRRVIPNQYLNGNSLYSISVQMCNFLSSCNQGSVTLSVLSLRAPVVRILGPSFMSTSRKDSLHLKATGYMSSCDGSSLTSSANMQYIWRVVDANKNSVALASSATPLLYISGFSLNSATQYTATVSVFSLSSGTSSTASVVVFVRTGSIVVVIGGGSSVTARFGDSTLLDASQSYDEDAETNAGSSNLVFAWTCYRLLPSYASDCQLCKNFSNPISSLVASVSDINATFVVTCSVFSFDLSRSSSTNINVNVVTAIYPRVKILSSLQDVSNANIASKISILASVTAMSVPFVCSWTVSDSRLNLATSATTSIVTAVPAAAKDSIQYEFPLNIALLPNVLSASATYIFEVQCSRAGSSGMISASSQITIVTNSPPLPGRFIVTPSIGEELVSPFELQASSWTDPNSNYPLTYVFGFNSPIQSSFLTLSSRLPQPYAMAYLPRGQGKNSSLTAVLYVYDTLDAYAVSVYNVRVVPSSQASNQTFTTSLLKERLVLAGDDTDSMKQALLSTVVVVNSVDCSRAPNCQSLNRFNCSSVSNTCGECLADPTTNQPYIGLSGASNEPCLSAQVLLLYSGRTCRFASDCLPKYQRCDSNTSTCAFLPKPCDPSCGSGAVRCAYANLYSGLFVEECTWMNPTCVAKCVCRAGFHGERCDVSDETMSTRQETRSLLVATMESIISGENGVDNSTVTSWIGGLKSVTDVPLDLSAASLSKSLDLVDAIASSAGQLGKSVMPTATSKLFNIIDNCASASADSVSNATTVLRRQLDYLNSLSSSALLSGESSNQLIFNNYRIVQQVLTAESSEDNVLQSLTMPLLVSENSTGQQPSSVSFSTVVSGVQSATASLLNSAVFGNNDDASNTLRLQTDVEGLCASDDSVPVYFKVQHTLPLNLSSSSLHFGDNVTYTTTCLADGKTTQHSYVCPFSDNVTVTCDGTVNRKYRSTCPRRRTEYECQGSATIAALAASSSSDSMLCQIDQLTSLYTVCKCYPCKSSVVSEAVRRRKMLQQTEDEEGQRKLSIDSTATTFAAETKAIMTYVFNDYADITLSIEEFSANDAQGASIVITFFSCLWGLTYLMIYVVEYNDIGDKVEAMLTYDKKGGKQADIRVAPLDEPAHQIEDQTRRYLSDYILTFFPVVFSNKPNTARLWYQVIHKHRYLFIFRNEKLYTKLVNSLETLSILTTYMYLTAVLYDVEWPNDDSHFCSSQYTEENCLSKKSIFDVHTTMCEWIPSADNGVNSNRIGGGGQVDMVCLWKEPDFDPMIQIILTMMVLLFSGPINIFINIVTKILLYSPTDADQEGSIEVLQSRRAHAMKAIGPATTATTTATTTTNTLSPSVAYESDKKKHRISSIAIARGTILQRILDIDPELVDYVNDEHSVRMQYQLTDPISSSSSPTASTSKSDTRSTVMAIQQPISSNAYSNANSFVETLRKVLNKMKLKGLRTELFEKQWGNYVADPVALSNGTEQLRNLQRELDTVTAEAKQHIRLLHNKPARIVGIQILQLFVLDLFGRQSKEARVYANQRTAVAPKRVVGWYGKGLCIFALLILNSYFILMCILYASQKGLRWQSNWAVTCLIYLLVDIFIKHVNIVYMVHFLIPGLISDQTQQMKKGIMRAISKLIEKCHIYREKRLMDKIEENKKKKEKEEFSVSDYLFVSAHLARAFPNLLESSIVSSYRSLYVSTHQFDTINGIKSQANSYSFSSINWKEICSSSLLSTIASVITSLLISLGCQRIMIQYLVIQMLDPLVLGFMAFIGTVAFESSLAGVLMMISLSMIALLVYSVGGCRCFNSSSRRQQSVSAAVSIASHRGGQQQDNEDQQNEEDEEYYISLSDNESDEDAARGSAIEEVKNDDDNDDNDVDATAIHNQNATADPEVIIDFGEEISSDEDESPTALPLPQPVSVVVPSTPESTIHNNNGNSTNNTSNNNNKDDNKTQITKKPRKIISISLLSSAVRTQQLSNIDCESDVDQDTADMDARVAYGEGELNRTSGQLSDSSLSQSQKYLKQEQQQPQQQEKVQEKQQGQQQQQQQQQVQQQLREQDQHQPQLSQQRSQQPSLQPIAPQVKDPIVTYRRIGSSNRSIGSKPALGSIKERDDHIDINIDTVTHMVTNKTTADDISHSKSVSNQSPTLLTTTGNEPDVEVSELMATQLGELFGAEDSEHERFHTNNRLLGVSNTISEGKLQQRLSNNDSNSSIANSGKLVSSILRQKLSQRVEQSAIDDDDCVDDYLDAIC